MNLPAIVSRASFSGLARARYYLPLVCLSATILLCACGGGSSSPGSGAVAGNGGTSGTTGGASNGSSAGSANAGFGGPIIGTLSMSASQVKLVAGNTGSFGNIDGVGTGARFHGASMIVIDSFGNIIVWDATNFVLRKISPSGQVSTLAGHYASDANGPDVCADGQGTAANLGGITSMSPGNGGDIYVLDQNCSSIRKITSSGQVSRIAQTRTSVHYTGVGGQSGYTKSEVLGGGLTFDRNSGNLYGTVGYSHVDYDVRRGPEDFGDNLLEGQIRQITQAGTMTTVAGAPDAVGYTDGAALSAQFKGPSDIVADGNGNLYINDCANHAIRKLDKTGTVSTVVAGVLVNCPSRLAMGQDGNLVLADTQLGIMHFSPTGKLLNTMPMPPNPSGNFIPLNIAIDTSNNMVFGYDATVTMLAPDGKFMTLAGMDRAAGSADGGASMAQFAYPIDLAADGAGNIYVVDAGNYTIRKIAPSGTVTTLAGTPGQPGQRDGIGAAAKFNNVSTLATDPTGNLLVLDASATGQQAIRKITVDGVVSTVFQAQLPLRLQGFAIDGSGTIYVSTINGAMAGTPYMNPQIQKLSSAGQLVPYLQLSSTVFNFVVDSQGNVFGVMNGVLRKTTPQGTQTAIAGNDGDFSFKDGVGAGSSLGREQKIVMDAGGNFYLPDVNGVIRKVTPQGVVSTYLGTWGRVGITLGTAPGSLFSPRGLAISGNTLYFTDANAVLSTGQ